MPASPIVLHANYFQFGSGQRLVFGPVLSCMQLWCRAGRGTIAIDGRSAPFAAGALVLLPWGHHITYQADRAQPFLVAGVHVIPAAAEVEPMPFNRIPHHGQRTPGMDAGRHPLPRRPDLLALAAQPALYHLGELAVELYQRGRPEVGVMRQLGALFLREWERALATPAAAVDQRLERLRRHVLDHLARPLQRAALARVIGASPSTLARLLKQASRQRPAAWVRQIRLEEARRRLTASNATLAEIAAATGFCDAFHLSRAFRRAFGMSPTEWRGRQVVPW